MSHPDKAFSWNKCIQIPFVLRRVFRQRDNGKDIIIFAKHSLMLLIEFVSMLNSMRLGQLTEQHIARFYGLTRAVNYDDGIEPSHLCVLNSGLQFTTLSDENTSTDSLSKLKLSTATRHVLACFPTKPAFTGLWTSEAMIHLASRYPWKV